MCDRRPDPWMGYLDFVTMNLLVNTSIFLTYISSFYFLAWLASFIVDVFVNRTNMVFKMGQWWTVTGLIFFSLSIGFLAPFELLGELWASEIADASTFFQVLFWAVLLSSPLGLAHCVLVTLFRKK